MLSEYRWVIGWFMWSSKTGRSSTRFSRRRHLPLAAAMAMRPEPLPPPLQLLALPTLAAVPCRVNHQPTLKRVGFWGSPERWKNCTASKPLSTPSRSRSAATNQVLYTSSSPRPSAMAAGRAGGQGGLQEGGGACR